MELNQRNIRRILFIVVCSIVIYLVLSNLSSVVASLMMVVGYLTPFIIGGAFAYILNVPMTLIENTLFPAGRRRVSLKVRRSVSILLSVIVVLAILFLVMFLLIPQLIDTFVLLYDIIPAFFKNIPKWINEWSERFPELEDWLTALEIDWNSIGSDILNSVRTGMSGIVSTTYSLMKSALGVTFNLILGFVFSIYVLAGKERLTKQVKHVLYAFLPEKRADRAVYIGKLSNRTFTNFVTGQLTEAVILGLLCFIGMAIFRFPFAPMASVLVGFTALIPLFGAFIGTAIGAFMILMVSPMKALWFIVYIIVLQQLEGNLIYPKVVGNSVGLPAMWVILAVTVGGSTMGVVGMLIFVPLFSVMYTLIREAVNDRLLLRKIDKRKLT